MTDKEKIGGYLDFETQIFFHKDGSFHSQDITE